jgi:hypothetical protein|nr:MAG TPA: hypothetical protein [Caudoviricetes sp.]
MINVVEMRLVKIVDMKLKKSDKQFLLDVKLDTGDSYVYVRDIEIANMDNVLNSVKIEQDNLTGDCMISRLCKNNLWVLNNTIEHEQKPKEMTLEDIEKALGYPVKIVEDKK